MRSHQCGHVGWVPSVQSHELTMSGRFHQRGYVGFVPSVQCHELTMLVRSHQRGSISTARHVSEIPPVWPYECGPINEVCSLVMAPLNTQGWVCFTSHAFSSPRLLYYNALFHATPLTCVTWWLLQAALLTWLFLSLFSQSTS